MASITSTPAAEVSASRLAWWWSERVERVDALVVTAVVSAWAALVVHDFGPRHLHGPAPGSDSFHGVSAGRVVAAMPGWVLMVVSMMGPVALPAIRHVAASSLRWRRMRAVLEFGSVYFGVWIGAGLVAIALTAEVEPSASLVGAVLLVAAAWQLTPAKRRALLACHRAIPMPPAGRRATIACARFGGVHARACIASCWPVMFAMALAPMPHAAWTAVLLPVVVHERWAPKPRRAARQSALVLAAAGAGVLLWMLFS